MSKLLQSSGIRLPQLMSTSGFHQDVGDGSKSFNAMSSDPLLSEAFGKGSDCTRLVTGAVRKRSNSSCVVELRDR